MKNYTCVVFRKFRMNKSSLSENRNIKVGALISYVSLAVSIVLHVFYTPYYLGRVGDAQFGLASFATSITSWFTIGAYALNDSFIKFSTAEKAERKNNMRSNAIYIKLLCLLSMLIVFLGLIILALLYFGIIPLNKYTDNEKTIIYILYFLSLTGIAFTTVFAFFRLYNEYQSNFIAVKSIALFSTISTFGFSFIALHFRPSVIVVSLIGLFVNITALFTLFVISKTKYKIKFGKDKLLDNAPYVKSIFAFSAFLLLSVIVTEINTAVDRTILGFFAGATYVTAYQLGMTFDIYFAEFSTSINSVFITRINKLVVLKKTNEINSLFLKLAKIQSLGVFLIIGGFAVCGKDFIIAWLGRTDSVVYNIGIILMLLHSVHYCSYSSLTIQRAYGKHRIPALINVCIAVLNVIISVVLVNLFPVEYSIYMCLIGTAFAEIIGRWILIPIYNSKALKLPMGKIYLNIIKFFVMCAIACLVTITLSNYLLHIDLRFNSYWVRCVLKGFIFLIVYLSIVIPINIKLLKSVLAKEKSVKTSIVSEHAILLELLKAELFDLKANIPNEANWSKIFESAKAQCIIPLVAAHVPTEHRKEWLEISYQSKAHFMQMIHEQNSLVKIFNDNKIPFVILKGTAAAIYYPSPSLRTYGDIDLYISENELAFANDVLIRNGYESEKNEERHNEYIKNGMIVELHTKFSSKNYNDIDHILINGLYNSTNYIVASSTFPGLPTYENGLVLLGHIMQHLKESGIGLRQIIDWMMFVHKELDDSSWNNHFRSLAAEAGLEKLAITVTFMCKKWMGLPDEITWCNSADEDAADWLLTRIFDDGNFGRDRAPYENVKASVRNEGIFKHLQRMGVENCTLARKCAFFRPFAWIYQLGRYTVYGISGQIKGKKVFIKDKQDMNIVEFWKRIE